MGYCLGVSGRWGWGKGKGRGKEKGRMKIRERGRLGEDQGNIRGMVIGPKRRRRTD